MRSGLLRVLACAVLLGVAPCASGDQALAPAGATTAPWVSDQGDGTYRNPVLTGDYSDPDVVRVGEDFYLTSSSFANAPGLPILHSRDLVNWTIIGHALARVPPDTHNIVPRHGGGVWAPCIRFHAGHFYIYYPDPDRGIFVVTASDPRGPWTDPVLVDASRGAIDPSPFWDDDGSAWLAMAWARSRAGFNNTITLKRMSADGMHVLDDGRNIIEGAHLAPVRTSIGMLPWTTIEGPKLYHRNGWYYVFAPAGGVKGGWQGVFRARSIEGPYEGRNVLDQGHTAVNGPHQGAWVDTPNGEDWFLHFQDTDSYGRRVWLEPMAWRDDWPVIGADRDGDGRGEPVLRFRKPHMPRHPIVAPQASDEFDGAPSLAWQWAANPLADWIDLNAPAGLLRLNAAPSSANLYEAGNLLTQKLPAMRFTATARLTFAPIAVGERAGLVVYGDDYAWIGVERTADGIRIEQVARTGANRNDAESVIPGPALAAQTPILLRIEASPVVQETTPPADQGAWPSLSRATHARIRFSFSLDGVTFTPIGAAFIARPGRWVGAQLGLFAQAPLGSAAAVALANGHADFDWFRAGS